MLTVYLIIAVITLVYLLQRHALSYWSRHGFPFVAPSFPFGNLLAVARQRRSFGLHIFELYKRSENPLLTGIYFFLRPALLIKDATLARRILTQDFNSFHDRGTYHSPKVDPMSGHMFNMPGAQWRQMRAKLTPTFTTGKLRSMMPIILAEGSNLREFLLPRSQKREVVGMKDLLDRYALNIIANVGFGMDVDTIRNPKHDFTRIEKIVNGPGLINSIRLMCAFLCPSVLYFFNTYAIGDEATEYFVDMTQQTFDHRVKNNVVRKDFIQLLLQLHKRGELGKEGDWAIGEAAAEASKGADASGQLSISECAAQSFLFYLAGFDTSASALAYTLFELVRHPELLKKLQREIDETLKRHDGEITYDAIQEMKYMEMCICETLRKYPTLPMLNRIATLDYPVPDTDLTIPKGTPIVISLLGIGRDERYFPDAGSFHPERFAEESKDYVEDAFIPFGEGPRMCIGLRLGKMIAKVGLTQLLSSFDFECVNDAEIEFHPFSVTMAPKGGVEIRVVERPQP